jgi:hypothetical protein
MNHIELNDVSVHFALFEPGARSLRRSLPEGLAAGKRCEPALIKRVAPPLHAGTIFIEVRHPMLYRVRSPATADTLMLGPPAEQFFRAIPPEVIEAAVIDGASESQVLFKVVMPMAAPVVATVAIITFLLNWAQWFPILVISRTPDTYTLPVALLSMNGELGANFQGIMALSVITTLPVAVLFLIAQKRVMEGMAAGAVKG